MRKNLKIWRASAAIAGLVLFASPSWAGTATGQFNVTATVLSACAVAATDLVFGNYSASTATPTDANNTLSVTCTSGLPYTLSLDGGTTASSVTARTMTDGSTHRLNYTLYTAAARSSIWGDGTTGTLTLGGTGTGALQTLSVYGRIPASQYIAAGAYTDRITITVNY